MSIDTWTPAAQQVSLLSQWRTEFEAAASIAAGLATTEFIPESLKVRNRDGTVNGPASTATVAAALLSGQELGLGPMASLRSIDVINGTPALRAITLRALVLSAGHDMWLESANDSQAVVKGQRKGSEHVQTASWDESRARALKLWDKPNWRAQKRTMLIARATAECARLVAPERVLGLGYTAEELADGADLPAMAVSSASDDPEAVAKPARASRRRRPPPAAVDGPVTAAEQPPPTDEPPFEDEPPSQRMITDEQRSKLMAAFGEAGITDRDERLATLAGILSRNILTSNDLTVSEASHAIDAVTAMAVPADERDRRDQ